MKKFRIYVTNITQACTVLANQQFQVMEGPTYIEVDIDPAKKMDVVTTLNSAGVVLYDIEEV